MSQETTQTNGGDKILFWGCFIALIATAFGFIVRALIINDWQADFNLTETQKGEIFGVGLWPFAISIVLFSLIIDKIGYGRSMVFAFGCHIVSAILTIAAPWVAARSDDPSATGYWMLYIGTFIVALGNGTVEAVINPVVATMFRKEKTKWLNILHAGWPGGLVLGGLLVLILMPNAYWPWKVALIFIPTILYGVMLFGRHFPENERVLAGVSYKEMLKEVGFLGALIVVALMTWEVTRVFEARGFIFQEWTEQSKFFARLVLSFLFAGAFGAYVRSIGQPLFVILLLIMMPLATTELGTDSWISDLMAGEMGKLGLSGGWVLVYTSFIMMVLRFFAGPIVHALSPLGLLAASAFIATIGLLLLSKSAGVAILLAATLYGVGKTFFWPTMLGIVAERFPKGGALTLNTIAGVGMLSVGVVGAQFLGFFQDSNIDTQLARYDEKQGTVLHDTYVIDEKISIFGRYTALDQDKVAAAPEADQAAVAEVIEISKKSALSMVAIFPAFMLLCYIALILYFRSQGGYKPVDLEYAGLEQAGPVDK